MSDRDLCITDFGAWNRARSRSRADRIVTLKRVNKELLAALRAIADADCKDVCGPTAQNLQDWAAAAIAKATQP